MQTPGNMHSFIKRTLVNLTLKLLERYNRRIGVVCFSRIVCRKASVVKHEEGNSDKLINILVEMDTCTLK